MPVFLGQMREEEKNGETFEGMKERINLKGNWQAKGSYS
jgi:hypothetical protein